MLGGGLRRRSGLGGLRAVLNIFMSALMDSEAHHAAACAATQRAVLHGMAFAASTEEGAAAFNVGVLETVFGLAYSADAGVRLQATQLLLTLATATSCNPRPPDRRRRPRATQKFASQCRSPTPRSTTSCS